MQGNVLYGEGHYMAYAVVIQLLTQLLNETKQKVNNYQTTYHIVDWQLHMFACVEISLPSVTNFNQQGLIQINRQIAIKVKTSWGK